MKKVLTYFIIVLLFVSSAYPTYAAGNARRGKKQTITASNKTFCVGSKNRSLGAKSKTRMSYKSSNSSVASLNSKGQLTAKKPGTARITITAKATATYKSAKKAITITVVPKGTSISSLSSPREKTFRVAIKKGSGISGYQVRYGTKSTMTGAKAFTTSSLKKDITIAAVKEQDVRYYVQVRTYKRVNGKNYYSSWSSKRSVTVKKHSHIWRAQYQTIMHSETGHYETQLVSIAYDEVISEEWRTYCNGCNADITDSVATHPCDASYHNKPNQITTHHPAVTKNVWVVDQPAWQENICIGYSCSSCGTTK
jgi:hypothetical protein